MDPLKEPPSPTRDSCTWQELSQHSTEDDCWVAIEGKVYNITRWIGLHPGGKDLLLLCAGRDITNMFESYHLVQDKPTEILKKYYVCDVSSTELPKYTMKSPFYATLRKRVAEHFNNPNNRKDPKNSLKMWSRLAFIQSLLFLTYYMLYYGPFTSPLPTIILAFLFGSSQALYSIHTMHDASHASITHNPKVWKYVGTNFDLLTGSSFFAWLHQHVLGHHIYTNVQGADPDIGENEVDFRRVSPAQQWFWFYKYQHIYAPIAYGLLTFKYRLQDWQTFVHLTNGRIRVLSPSFFQVIFFILGKICFIIIRIVIPLFYMSLGRVIMIFMLAEFVTGYYLTFFFQINHVAEGLPLQPAPGTITDDDWAIAQVRTTQDYSHGNKLTTLLSGSLNYQVVHHLFPTVAQDYYPEIAPIVLRTCEEFGVKYNVLPSLYAAFVSHLSYLRRMGQPPEAHIKRE